jgi:hypothetical protein
MKGKNYYDNNQNLIKKSTPGSGGAAGNADQTIVR